MKQTHIVPFLIVMDKFKDCVDRFVSRNMLHGESGKRSKSLTNSLWISGKAVTAVKNHIDTNTVANNIFISTTSAKKEDQKNFVIFYSNIISPMLYTI